MMIRLVRGCLVSGAVFALLLAAIGCSSTGMSRRGSGSQVDPDTLYTNFKRAYATANFESAEADARVMIVAYPDDPRIDEVYTLAARSSYELGDYSHAVRYAEVIGAEYKMSPYWEDALLLTADAYRELGRYYDSALVLSELLASPLAEDVQTQVLAALRELSGDKLGVNDLERLVEQYPTSPLAAEMSLGIAKREFARGNYDRAYEMLAQHLFEFPQHGESPEVRQLLKLSASRRNDPERTVDYVDPYKVGVVLPLTGKYSRFGRYFEQGALLAVDEFNDSSGTQLTLVRGDSRGDPVDAVNAVRRLAVEDGVLAILGEVFSVSTMGAAIEANAWRVPLVSPVVSEQRIDEIGPWVFQTRVSREVEVSAIASVAVEGLLLKRFAVLSPTSPERRKLAEFFVQEITHRGGEVVAQGYYPPGATDFRDQLDIIRQAAPEALFIPGDPEELMLLLPQVSFYDLQIQLLGLSDWSSEKLLRLSERELEGALFPGEAFYGKSRESNDEFVRKYQDRFGGEVDEVHPIATAGYFGMRLLLESVAAGAIERRQVKDFLQNRLESGAEQRMAEANQLSILKVTGGRIREFTAYLTPDTTKVND